MLTAEQIVDVLTDTDSAGCPLSDAAREGRRAINTRILSLEDESGRSGAKIVRLARVEWLEAQMKEWGKE